ncbi:MAG TPA: hypothetical protein DDZ41_09095 [Flavobacterium sp.]|nr:hypothetical protein [Flavobacterium sp.]
MIPKIIHYCWFGGAKKSGLIKECIQSWHTFLPDYKIVEWNETNSDLSHPFVQKAYQQKMWAFVSDYVRLDVLSKYGGIYLDTDMMILKNFDALLNHQCFFGAEDKNFINCSIIGCQAGFQFIEKCKLIYNEVINVNATKEITIPKLVTNEFREYYAFKDVFTEILKIDEITIYPEHYFYPLPYSNKWDLKNYKNYIHIRSFAVHLWSSSWVPNSEFQDIRNGYYYVGFKKVWNKIKRDKKINWSYIKKIVSALKTSLTNEK